jgi:hypothetical protein
MVAPSLARVVRAVRTALAANCAGRLIYLIAMKVFAAADTLYLQAIVALMVSVVGSSRRE